MGELIHFDDARRRIAARRVETLSMEDPEYWRADLATWPPVFQRRVGRNLERILEIADAEEIQRLIEHRTRGTDGEWSSHFMLRVRWIRSMAQELREARTRGVGQGTLQHRVACLGAAKEELLWALFSAGVRRIERAELREWARAERQRQAADMRWVVAGYEESLARVNKLLDRGVYAGGAKRGLPYRSEYRAQLHKRRRELERVLASVRRLLARITGTCDPLRAVGFYNVQLRRAGAA